MGTLHNYTNHNSRPRKSRSMPPLDEIPVHPWTMTFGDLKVGEKLVCVYVAEHNRMDATLGEVFTIVECSAFTFNMHRADPTVRWNCRRSEILSINCFRDDIPLDYGYSVFVPLSRFSNEDVFEYRLSGSLNLHERFWEQKS